MNKDNKISEEIEMTMQLMLIYLKGHKMINKYTPFPNSNKAVFLKTALYKYSKMATPKKLTSFIDLTR